WLITISVLGNFPTAHVGNFETAFTQTFGPVDTFMAWQVSPDDIDELMFAHDKCQGGMLVGIWHDMSCSADTKKPAGEGGPCVRMDGPWGGGYRSRSFGIMNLWERPDQWAPQFELYSV
ncbi:hypothetical protein, partial [Komagataeibacter rhaeticus]|uniref:hypothetical protein n=1 Tax=Komagataeibacter rhaeticus TaxID=215221 RepID=UPI002490610B